jgi:hypothetical protein
MHRLARWPSARKSLVLAGERKPLQFLQGSQALLRLPTYLLVVEQVLEIIFTFFTLKVPEEEEPAPVALEPLLLPDELPMLPLLELGELPVLPLLELGELPMLPLLEPEAEPLLSVPVMRT